MSHMISPAIIWLHAEPIDGLHTYSAIDALHNWQFPCAPAGSPRGACFDSRTLQGVRALNGNCSQLITGSRSPQRRELPLHRQDGWPGASIVATWIVPRWQVFDRYQHV